MDRQSEISSTERLLDVIRTGSESPEVHQPPERGVKAVVARLSSLLKDKPSRDTVVIGVDIGYSAVRLVKTTPVPPDKWELIDYKIVPFREGLSRDDPEFIQFLRKALHEFSRNNTHYEIWTLMSSAQVDIQHIRIPKMARKKIENAVYFMAKKNVPFDDKVSFFDYEVQGEVVESGVEKLATLAYTAPRSEVKALADLFENAGYPLTGMTIAPFAIQNIFKTNWIPSYEKTVVTLYIGRDWSRIDTYSSGNFVMTRGIKAGINSMIESLMDEFNERSRHIQIEPFQDSETFDVPADTVPPREEGPTITSEEARTILFSLGTDSFSSSETAQRLGLTEEEVFDLIRPALERLVRQIERTFDHYVTTFGDERIETIFISSAMGVYQPIVDYIGDQLRIESDILDPLKPGNTFVGDFTEGTTIAERAPLLPALGLALSDTSRTLNHVFTYKDKKRQIIMDIVNISIIAVFGVFMLISLGYFLWLGHVAEEKRAVVVDYEKSLSSDVVVNERVIMDMVKKIRQEQKTMEAYKVRYLDIAAISELSTLTPPNIRLYNINANFESRTMIKGKEVHSKDLVIEGVAMGEGTALGSTLAGYIFRLDQSPMFSKPIIIKKSEETLQGKKALRFTLRVTL